MRKLVEGWKICQLEKIRSQYIGFYIPLLVLEKPWEDVSMYFVLGLLTKQRGKDYNMVVVNIF